VSIIRLRGLFKKFDQVGHRILKLRKRNLIRLVFNNI